MHEEQYNKKSFVALLIRLAKADNIIDPAEIAFINDICERIGIEETAQAEIWQNSDAYPLNTPDSERHRLTILYQLLNLMKSDGEVSPEEEDFVRHTGKLLHLNEVLIEEFLQLAKNTDTTHVAPELFVENFKKYLN